MTLAALRAQDFADQAEAHYATSPSKIFIPNAIPRNNNIGYEYESVEQAFPPVAAPWRPLGSTVMVQLRLPLRRSAGGLIIDAAQRQTDQDNTQIARVVAVGPLAFRNRETGQQWPEGAWCAVGDFVRVPKYQGDRSVVEIAVDDHEIDDRGKRHPVKTKDNVVFVAFKDLAIIGRYDTAEAALTDRAFI